jgi:Na+/melibiose symporter and related transporters
LISQILNAIGIICLGALFDTTKAKHGAAKSWILWFAIPHSIALMLTFFVPNFGSVGKIIYAFVTYNLLTTVCYSAINLAYSVLNTRMTTNQLDRSDLSVFRTIAAAVVTIIVNLLTLKIVAVFGNNARAWTFAMLIYAIAAIILFLGTYLFTKERVSQVKDSVTTETSEAVNLA